jgi:hypothetical protein
VDNSILISRLFMCGKPSVTILPQFRVDCALPDPGQFVPGRVTLANRQSISAKQEILTSTKATGGNMKNIISKFLPLIAFTVLMFTAPHLPASAGEGDKYMGAPAPSQAWGPGLMVRLRGLAVLPDEDGSNITANGAPITADIKMALSH